MQSVIPPGDPDRIVVAGKSQGFLGLAIAYGEMRDSGNGGVYPTMTTAWEPNDAERAALAAGANIIIRILGSPPINPMMVMVGDIPKVIDHD